MELNEFTDVGYAVEAGVATVTLNRPERRNTWAGRMDGAVREEFSAFPPAARIVKGDTAAARPAPWIIGPADTRLPEAHR